MADDDMSTEKRIRELEAMLEELSAGKSAVSQTPMPELRAPDTAALDAAERRERPSFGGPQPTPMPTLRDPDMGALDRAAARQAVPPSTTEFNRLMGRGAGGPMPPMPQVQQQAAAMGSPMDPMEAERRRRMQLGY